MLLNKRKSYAFKLSLLNKKLTQNISFDLTPTFLNYMVKELDEYQQVLRNIGQRKFPSVYELHLLWIQDAYGHASAIKSLLDLTETRLARQADEFDSRFRNLYIKVSEMSKYRRAQVGWYSALLRLNTLVRQDMNQFRAFLYKLRRLERGSKVLGSMGSLLADQMLHEECYYLTKLAMVTRIRLPKCRATRPRITS